MGCRIPPLALSPEEFQRRIDGGAKTMREIDPALYEWLDAGRRLRAFAFYCLLLGSVFICILLAVVGNGG